MGTKYLIDSNILIKFEGRLLPEKAQAYVANIIDEDFNISVIIEIEVLGHHSATKEVEEFIGLANLFEIDKAIRTATIQLRKQYKIKLPDAIIAATALTHGFTLVTQNEKDFVNIDGLQVTNPFNI